MTIDELRSAAAVVRDATEEGENTATRIGQLFLDTVNTLCNVSTNAIKGYVVISSTSDLPTSPTTDQQMKGYLLDTTLYVWVGNGGDTLDGKYQSAQLKGEDGKTGEKGDSGVSLGEVVLVNDLTTGGDGNALSAEMGKTLNERLEPVESTLEINSSSEVVTERIPYAQNSGYINGQTPASNSLFRYSDPILLKAGESLKMKAITPTNVWRLSSYDPTTKKYSKILSGESSGMSSASNAYENTYTATEDIYVTVCWYWDHFQLELTLTHEVTTTTSKIDELDIISEALEVKVETSTKTVEVPIVAHTGGAYAHGGVGNIVTIGTYSQYSYSDDFFLKKGEILNISLANVASSVCVLCVKDAVEGGTDHRNLAVGNGESTQAIQYTAPTDGYYAVSWLTSTGITITKTGTRTKGDSERIVAIEESTTQIPALVSSVAALNGAVFDNVSDDMTEGYVDGYFVKHNGEIAVNSSFAYKEFEVRAGAVINFTGGMHPNLAAIAKKLTSNSFEELVPATAQSVQSFTYTATVDMTIAVSFSKGSDRSITIVAQNVESNRLNIKNLLDAQSQLNQMFNTPDYGLLFDKVAVIGDSLTVGTLDAATGDDGHVAGGSFGCSWLTYLAKKWGSSVRMHYGAGGSTCYSWLGNNSYGLGLMLKDSVVYDVYFVAYGHNDAGVFTIGTTSDTPTAVTVDAEDKVTVDTPAANTTFLGNYKKIVNEIRTKAPNALIFMVCTDKKDSTDSRSIGYMNQYIRQLAEWYYGQGDHKVFYLDYISKYVEKAGYHTGGHWSTFGYANIGRLINNAVNDVIEAYLNTNALKVWGNYLESYRTTKYDQTM